MNIGATSRLLAGLLALFVALAAHGQFLQDHPLDHEPREPPPAEETEGEEDDAADSTGSQYALDEIDVGLFELLAALEEEWFEEYNTLMRALPKAIQGQTLIYFRMGRPVAEDVDRFARYLMEYADSAFNADGRAGPLATEVAAMAPNLAFIEERGARADEHAMELWGRLGEDLAKFQNERASRYQGITELQQIASGEGDRAMQAEFERLRDELARKLIEDEMI